MPGSTIQLQAAYNRNTFSTQDSYILSQDPRANFFEYAYMKYTNFASEIIKIPTNEKLTWGKKTHAVIPRAGHLLSNLYLSLELPALDITSGEWTGWSDTLGYSIFKKLELEIGGIIVETLEPEFMDIYDELARGKENMGGNKMILKSDTYVATQRNGIRAQTLMIPLPFFFSRQYNLSLPIVSLTNPDIRIHMEFKQFDQCVHYDGATPPTFVDIIDANVYGEYYYLDESILDTFEQKTHNFVIDSVMYNGIESISPGLGTHISRLRFNHLVRELAFVLVDSRSVENNDHFNYSRYSDSHALLKSANMYMVNSARFENDLPEVYLRTVFPFRQHTVVPNKHIYIIPFCLDAESNQPTGALNFSRLDNVSLHLKMESGNPEVFLHTFAVYHNFITIANGSLYIEFNV
jgi:hypothetical protein